MSPSTPTRRTVLRFRLCLSLALGFLLAASIPASASAEETVRRVLAEPGSLDLVPGAVRLHDYESFSLYSVPETALESLPAELRRQILRRSDHDVLVLGGRSLGTRETPRVPPALTAPATPGPGLQVVQFVGPIHSGWLDDLRAAGAEPVHYLAHDGYLTWADAAGRAWLEARAGEGTVVQYTDRLQPYFKLGPSLAERLEAKVPNLDEELPVTIQIFDHSGRGETERAVAERARGEMSAWQPILRYRNATLR